MYKFILFDIQRCSLVDGPGLRTTVFLKGCNLRCRWCHNPESQSFAPQLFFRASKCKGCGRCRDICPHHLESCELCGKCALYCPGGARELCGREESIESVLEEVMKDRMYYDASGGGVTVSGGECMLQIEPLAEFLRLCKEAGIQTAADTAGSVPWESFLSVIPYTDLFLYDLKCFDEALHRENTGVSNRLILENLRRLAKLDKDKITVRIPVVPGVNDTREEMEGMASFLDEIGVKSVELLPYHRLGEHKYEDLGQKHESFDVPSKEDMEKFKEYFNI